MSYILLSYQLEFHPYTNSENKCENNISKLCFNLNEETKIPYSSYIKEKKGASEKISRLYELYNHDVVFSSNYERWVLGAQEEDIYNMQIWKRVSEKNQPNQTQ